MSGLIESPGGSPCRLPHPRPSGSASALDRAHPATEGAPRGRQVYDLHDRQRSGVRIAPVAVVKADVPEQGIAGKWHALNRQRVAAGSTRGAGAMTARGREVFVETAKARETKAKSSGLPGVCHAYTTP